MIIIGKPKIEDFKLKHPDASSQADSWFADAKEARWQNPQDVKQRYPRASILKGNQVIFDLRGNRYRVRVQIDYKNGIILIIAAGTHQEYMKWK